MAAPGPGVAAPDALVVVPVLVMMLMMMLTMRDTKAHHQYSLRLARPEKVAYFLKNRWTACWMVAP
jgi:hypothetical protein